MASTVQVALQHLTPSPAAAAGQQSPPAGSGAGDARFINTATFLNELGRWGAAARVIGLMLRLCRAAASACPSPGPLCLYSARRQALRQAPPPTPTCTPHPASSSCRPAGQPLCPSQCRSVPPPRLLCRQGLFKKDIAPFAERWVYGRGVPRITAAYLYQG